MTFMGASLFHLMISVPTIGGLSDVSPPNHLMSAADAATPRPLELDQVQWCREGLLDAAARPEVRRRWASRLILLGTPNAKATVAELLTRKDSPDTRRILADALAEHARTNRTLLDDAFVPPLLELLGHEAAEYRAAAARALAEFPGSDIVQRLGAIIRDAQTSAATRLAAIEALAPNVHRREVIELLITTLDSAAPDAAAAIMTVLQPISRDPCGHDAACWRAWWSHQSTLKEEERLTELLQMYRDRALVAQRDLDTLRESSRRYEAAMAARVVELLRNDYRQTPVEQRDARLVEWLKDPLPEVTLGAIEIIKARLADEGQRPEGAVRSALLQELREGPVSIRRGVLEIIQNLNDPDVVQALLARLDIEDDAATRAGIFRALGKLTAVDAIPQLIRELSANAGSTESLRECAIAIGLIASSRPESRPSLAAAVEPLRNRYYSTSFAEVPLKSALLSAMAGMADESFRSILLDALESNDPAILRPAIRGLRNLGDVSKLPRLRTLTADKDPLVRRSATEAVGLLAREDSDFESLIPRLNPSVENNEAVRQAAWAGFMEWQKRKPPLERIKAAERLRDLPELEIRYLAEIVDGLEISDATRSAVADLHERLANTFVSQGKYAAAVHHYRELHGILEKTNADITPDVGSRWLDAMLRSSNYNELAELFQRLLAEVKTDEARNRLITTVTDYVSSLDLDADIDRTRRLLAELRAIPAEDLGEHWKSMMIRLTDKARANGNNHGASRAGVP